MAAMTEAEKKHRKWLRQYYGSLKHWTCVKVEIKREVNEYSDWAEDWPQLTFMNANGDTMVIEVARDEEGNGPGFLFGLPLPQNGGAQ